MSAATGEIVKRVAEALGGASPADVRAGKRNKWACRIRHVSALILRRRGMSFPLIAAELGGLDHTTAMNGCKRAAEMEVADDLVAGVIAAELARDGGQIHRQPPEPSEHAKLLAACRSLLDAAGVNLEHAVDGEMALYVETYAAGLRSRRPADPPTRCTGITASWCPRCGDCKCSRPDGFAGDMDSPQCPLHALNSTHGDDAEDDT